MKRKTWLCIITALGFISMFVSSCNPDEMFQNYPNIRLQTGVGLNNGASINFIALCKNDNFSNLTTDQLFAFVKTNADWHIDGGVIPFTTSYKELKDDAGDYYLLLRATGLAMTTRVKVLPGKQTFQIYAQSGSIRVEIVQPK